MESARRKTMPNESKGDLYAIVEIGHQLVVSLYDGGKGVMPDEVLRQYRSHFNLNENEPLQLQLFGKLGCKLFLSRGANPGESTQLLTTGIFVPAGVALEDALKELADAYSMEAVNFDSAVKVR